MVNVHLQPIVLGYILDSKHLYFLCSVDSRKYFFIYLFWLFCCNVKYLNMLKDHLFFEERIKCSDEDGGGGGGGSITNNKFSPFLSEKCQAWMKFLNVIEEILQNYLLIAALYNLNWLLDGVMKVDGWHFILIFSLFVSLISQMYLYYRIYTSV